MNTVYMTFIVAEVALYQLDMKTMLCTNMSVSHCTIGKRLLNYKSLDPLSAHKQCSPTQQIRAL